MKKKRLGKKLSQIEKPDDLQSIANHPVFFVCMTPSMMEITKKRPSANSWCDDLADTAFGQKSSKQRKLRTKSAASDVMRSAFHLIQKDTAAFSQCLLA